MMADPFESTPEFDERPPTTIREGSPFRLTLSTIMIAVLASATSTAMTVRVYQFLEGDEEGEEVAALLLIAVILTAIAIGSWRRSSLAAILLQITVCCAFIAGVVELAEPFPRVFRYTLQVWSALFVALPLVIRRYATPSSPSKRQRPRLVALSEFLLGCGANLMLVWIGMWLQLFFLNW